MTITKKIFSETKSSVLYSNRQINVNKNSNNKNKNSNNKNKWTKKHNNFSLTLALLNCDMPYLCKH